MDMNGSCRNTVIIRDSGLVPTVPTSLKQVLHLPYMISETSQKILASDWLGLGLDSVTVAGASSNCCFPKQASNDSMTSVFDDKGYEPYRKVSAEEDAAELKLGESNAF